MTVKEVGVREMAYVRPIREGREGFLDGYIGVTIQDSLTLTSFIP